MLQKLFVLRKKAILFLGCLFPAVTPAQVFINEISICNVSQQLDPNFDYTGWIELYNASTTDLNIRDLYFSDEVNNPLKYKLKSNRILPAGGFALVWLNDEIKGLPTVGGGGVSLNTDADDGGLLFVSNKKGDRYDSLAYGKQYTNVSYGRTVDGDVKSPFAYFLTASPQASNVGSASSSTWVLPPQISQSSGFYTNGFNVNISCETLDAQLFYTLDASEPTRESLPYKGTIRIDTTTVLRVCAFKDDCFCSPIVTKTYLLNERKPETLPVVFLTTAPSNLYDDSLGIYCEGKNGIVLTGGGEKANYNRSWTRLGHFEIQDWKENLFEEQSIGLSINGHASRSYDQKSFKLKAKTRYGAKRFDMPIFPQKTGYRYKTLLLRNGGQFYNVVPHLHDACLQSLADVTPLNYQVAKPSVVYLNGEYWGLYNIREAKNKDMIYSHYGLDETEFDLLEYNWRLRVNNGSKNKWLMVEDSIRAFDYTQKEACEKVKKLIDLDNYLYYMSIELLIQNTDWPANNQALFCSHRKNNKWRWILQDLDKGLETSSNLNLLETLRKSTSKLMCTKLICYILQNKEIANHYITTQSLVAGSVFRSDRFKSRLMEMKEAIAAEHSYYAARWPKQGRNPLDKTVDLMITKEATLCKYAFDNLKTNFELGAVHPLVIDTEQKAICIQFNEQRIPDLPYNGKWFEGKSLTLIAPLYHKAKKFAYWEISSGGAVRKNANTTLELLLTDSTHVTPIYEETRYARREGLYINEVSAENKTNVDKNYKYEDWIELYNSSNADIHLVGYYLSNNPANKELFQFSTTDVDATTIPANGYAIVWCSKKPERGVMHTNFKLAKLGGSLFLCKKEQGDLQLVDSLTYIEHDSKTSFGRSTDGGETFVKFDVPTFFKANLYSSYNEYVYTEDYPLIDGIQTVVAKRKPKVWLDQNTLSAEGLAPFTLKLYNVAGRLVKANQVLSTKQTFHITDLMPGTSYIVVIETANERFAMKFIK